MTEDSGPTRKDGLTPEAHAAYMREYRKTPAGQASLVNQRARQKAHRKAHARLAAKYYHDYLVLLNEELRKARLEETS